VPTAFGLFFTSWVLSASSILAAMVTAVAVVLLQDFPVAPRERFEAGAGGLAVRSLRSFTDSAPNTPHLAAAVVAAVGYRFRRHYRTGV